MSDYQPTTIRFNNVGIVLRDDAELLKEGNYLIVKNVRSTFEGSITGRAGRGMKIELPAEGVIHTIRRIDQDHVFIGTGKRGYSNDLLLTTVPPVFLPVYQNSAINGMVEAAQDGTFVELKPASQGTDDNWCLGDGVTCGSAANATKWQILAGVLPGFVLPNSGATPETFNFGSLDIDISSKIDKLRLVATAQAAADDPPPGTFIFDRVKLRTRLNETVADSPEFSGEGNFPTTNTFEWEPDRPGGGTWTVQDVNDAEFGFAFHNWSGHATPAHFTLTLEVTYSTPPPSEPTIPWEPFSGAPLSTVPFTPLIGNRQWLYIGDTSAMLKTAGKHIDGMGEPVEPALLVQWGITAPTGDFPNPPVILTGTPGGLDSSAPGATVYDWRYTYYSSFTGAESNPNEEMSTGLAVVGNSVRLTAKLSLDPQVDKVRFYRRGGVLSDTWRLVGAGDNNANFPMPNAVVTFDDGVADVDLEAARFIELDNFQPFPSENQEGDPIYGVSVPNIWGPFAGSYIMACGDANRPGHAYWTNPNRSDSADIENHVFVTPATEPLVRGFVYNGGNYVWSQDNLYALDYSGPGASVTFVPRKTSVGRGTVGPHSYAIGPLIWFVHGSGIYETDGQSPPVSITELSLRPIFENRSYGGLEPVNFANFSQSIRLVLRGSELHFHYVGTGNNRFHLIYDLIYKRWMQDTTGGFKEVMSYADENTAQDTLLIGTNTGTVLEADVSTTDALINGGSSTILSQVQTGRIDLGNPNIKKEVDQLLVDFSTYSNGTPIAATVYTDLGVGSVGSFLTNLSANPTGQRAKYPILTSSFGQSKLPTYVYNFALDLKWSGPYSQNNNRIHSLEVFWRPDKPHLTYWVQPETTHGLSGWQLLRDVYLSMENTCNVVFNLRVDGINYTYNIPAGTALRKDKVHIWIDPIKGKLFKYSLERDPSDSSDPTINNFRVYGEFCEVRVKPWNTSLGYQLVSPWAAGGQ